MQCGVGLLWRGSLDLHWIERGETVVVFGARAVTGTHSPPLPSLSRVSPTFSVRLTASLSFAETTIHSGWGRGIFFFPRGEVG